MVADYVLEDMTYKFMPRQRYRVDGRWTWRMRREGQTFTSQGVYILSKIIHTFSNSGVREELMLIDHPMVLAELRG